MLPSKRLCASAVASDQEEDDDVVAGADALSRGPTGFPHWNPAAGHWQEVEWVSLISLPEELQQKIVAMLGTHRDMVSICLTCSDMLERHQWQVLHEEDEQRFNQRLAFIPCEVLMWGMRDDLEQDHPDADEDELIGLFRTAMVCFSVPRPYCRGTADLTVEAIVRHNEQLRLGWYGREIHLGEEGADGSGEEK